MAILGFMSRSDRAIQNDLDSERRRKIEERTIELRAKKRQDDIERAAKMRAGLIKQKQREGFGSQFRKELQSVGRTVQTQNTQQRQDVRQSVVVQNRPVNFFEHHDEQEVYGDEGLTFFDSKKSRGAERTGNMFGF